MPRDEPQRRFKMPCRSCGGYEVKIVVTGAMEPDKELVLGNCAWCEVVRCRYVRLIRSTPRST